MINPEEIELSNFLTYLINKDFKLYEKLHPMVSKMDDENKTILYSIAILGDNFHDEDWNKFLEYRKEFKAIPKIKKPTFLLGIPECTIV